tara:strand:+ start:183 stop:623 length:441 start_codon:yes stop_codon:yes gene_type:complete
MSMEIKEILNPKGWLIGLGAFLLVFSIGGILNPESVAEMAWGKDVVITDQIIAYEAMWALHMLPIGILAIATAIFTKGETLAKMAMTSSASFVVIVGGGMGYFTNKYDYSTEGTMALVMPLIVMSAAILMGVAGYLHKDGPDTSTE